MDKTKNLACTSVSKAFFKYGLQNVRHFILWHGSETEVDAKEKFYISKDGFDLMNSKIGYNLKEGGANARPSETTVARMKDAARRQEESDPGFRSRRTKAFFSTAEGRRKHSEAAKRANAQPHVKAKRSAAQKEAKARPEIMVRQRAAAKLAFSRPEVKAKKSASAKRACHEFKEKYRSGAKLLRAREALVDPGCHSRRMRAVHSRPEVKDKVRAGATWRENNKARKSLITILANGVLAYEPIQKKRIHGAYYWRLDGTVGVWNRFKLKPVKVPDDWGPEDDISVVVERMVRAVETGG
jgi:hypothetical protein